MNQPIVNLSHIAKRYGDHIIYEDFNLSIYKGEMICVAGASGSGKSTLLNMIGMFDTPDSGEITLFGKPLPSAASHQGRLLMHDQLFYLFQNFALIEHKSIDYNLEIPFTDRHLPRRMKQRAKKEALEKVHLQLDLKEKIYQLSGGEQQRVALARGYLKPFSLLLADEPTGSLDSHNRDEIIGLLKDFQKEGKTIIVVSHDPVVMKSADRLIQL